MNFSASPGRSSAVSPLPPSWTPPASLTRTGPNSCTTLQQIAPYLILSAPPCVSEGLGFDRGCHSDINLAVRRSNDRVSERAARSPVPRPTLSAMAYEIARGVLEQYPIMQRIEVHLIHFSRGLESKDEAEDNHVVNLVLQR